jgi:hypothetical protein
MSTAPRFIFPGSFPFCVEEIAGFDSHASHIANLTLAEAMAFAWNIETLTITTAGTATFGALVSNASADLCINAWSSSRFDIAALNDAGMWFGAAVAETALGSLPAIRQPRGRVCDPGPANVGCLMDLGFALSTDERAFGILGFWVGTDPINSGKYRLYYRYSIWFSDPTTQTIDLNFTNESTNVGMSSAGSGTLTIGGFSFDWYAFRTTAATPSGISMSASSGSFTY